VRAKGWPIQVAHKEKADLCAALPGCGTKIEATASDSN